MVSTWTLLAFSLLRNRVNSNLKLQVGNKGLTIPLPSPAQRPKITSIDRWLDAFAIYSSVILYSYPSRGVDLISYQQLIRESARKFPGMAWYVYDVKFRCRTSHNLSKKWGERDVQLYLDTFPGLPKGILCKSCSSSDHFMDSCPLSPRSKDSPRPNHADLCNNLNKGVPCAGTPCPYSKNILKEVQLGHTAGPFISPPFPNFQVYPIGVVPKKNTPPIDVQFSTFHIPNTTPQVLMLISAPLIIRYIILQ